MERAVEIAGYVNNVLFVALALVASYQWLRQRGEATGWFAATFLVLAAIVIANWILPDDADTPLLEWVEKLRLATLVLFPYFLYRFMGSFVRRARWVKVLAVVLTLGVMAWTFFLPEIPGDGEPRSTAFDYWLIAFLAQWSILSLMVTVRLWIAGRGQPSVARWRMRLLSLGAFGITAVLVLSGSTSGQDEELAAFSMVVSIMTFLSALAFFFGFAPPAWLRVVWRRPESDALNRGISGLMAARTPEDVGAKLLPHVVRILGARGAALVDADGRVISTHGVSESMLEDLSAVAPNQLTTPTKTQKLLILPYEFGTLVVWASRYTPFFGREEVGLITSLGALTDVAMERAALFRSVETARTELEEVNVALARREAMLAEAQKISRMGSWEWDVETKETAWSEEMYRIFGVDRDVFDPTKDDFISLVHPEDREFVQSIVDSTVANREGFEFEYRIVHPNGDVRALHTSGKIDTTEDTGARRLFGVVHDITERKESERALADAFSRERLARVGVERANQELESFVYTVSHDLNSPLISVLGYIDLLEGDFGPQLPEEARFYLERVKASSAYMQSLIKDLLELSRVGRVQTEPDDVDLDLLIAEIANEVRARHPDVSVEVKQDLPDIHMNPLRARQLFANLIQNSVKYAKRPDVRIEVDAEPDGNGLITLSVADNGPGIAAENRERVFGVFERLDTAEEGTGIGLAVCKRIVETSGGRIWIADSDVGTDVRVSVPVSSGNGAGGGQN
ncbi:MAG: PAS domain-containing protein [Actinobacteria bacterium]|nr:PAS domain-containing protein [Actinomycetota bacterium]